MRVTCPSCGNGVPAKDVNLDRMVAKCTRCDEVFWLERTPQSDRGGKSDEGPLRAQKKVPRPSDITVVGPEDTASATPAAYRVPSRAGAHDALVLRRRWFRPIALFYLLFVAVWDGFLVVWYSAVLFGARSTDAGPILLLPLLFPILHVAAGVWLTYYTASLFLNRTEIRADRLAIRVEHRPLPWRGNLALPTERVRQLFTRPSPGFGQAFGVNQRGRGWELMADTVDDQVVKVLGNLPTRDHAVFLERAIEDHLGLEDDPSRDDRG